MLYSISKGYFVNLLGHTWFSIASFAVRGSRLGPNNYTCSHFSILIEIYMFTPPKVAHYSNESCSQEEEGNSLGKVREGFDQITFCYLAVDEHIGWRRAIEEREMLFLHGELYEGRSTRRVRGTLTEVGGSGRSQVGGIPALRGVKGADLLIRFASLMIIIQLLQLHTKFIFVSNL